MTAVRITVTSHCQSSCYTKRKQAFNDVWKQVLSGNNISKHHSLFLLDLLSHCWCPSLTNLEKRSDLVLWRFTVLWMMAVLKDLVGLTVCSAVCVCV